MGTISKALELLNYFTKARPLIGLSDLARLAELNKATCFRLLTELADNGFVEQIGTSREYRLGPSVLRLAALREAQVPTREAAMPVLQVLAQQTGETAHLSLLIADILRPLAHAYSAAHATKVMLEDTEALPFHATSSGLAVLAFQPEAFRNRILAQPLPRLTTSTETVPAALRACINEVRALGYAESRGGYESDVHSMAVPLFDALGRCSGALAVAALGSRMGEAQRRKIRHALLQAGTEITTLWGGTLPADIATLWRLAA
ncbi:MAG: IclR family transcriptional regulator [Pseudorhodobacter sp. PARRP1]|nr:MAG: IclR family transcriptional regulator [Pseudorhodobacter sp. PARRP1]